MVKIERYGTIGYSLVPKWIELAKKVEINLEKERVHMTLRTQDV